MSIPTCFNVHDAFRGIVPCSTSNRWQIFTSGCVKLLISTYKKIPEASEKKSAFFVTYINFAYFEYKKGHRLKHQYSI